MNEAKKEITREQLYEEVWRRPLTKLAADWGVPIAGIVKGCGDTNVPATRRRVLAIAAKGVAG